MSSSQGSSSRGDHSSSKDLIHDDSFRPNFQSIVEYDDDDDNDDESIISRDNLSIQSDSFSCAESVSSDILQQHYLPTVQARKLRLSKAVKKSNYGKSEPIHIAEVDPVSIQASSSAKSLAPIKDVSSSSNYVYGGGRRKDYTSYFMGLDHGSLEEMKNHYSPDKIDDISKKLQLTKCVTYLSPDAISWMNKRRPHAINDKTLHYSHITPSKALQLLAIFRGLDHDNSGQISKKELQDALRYVTASSQKNELTEEILSRKTSTFGQSSTNPSRRGSVISQISPSIHMPKRRESDAISLRSRKSSIMNSVASKLKPISSNTSLIPKEISKDSLSHLFDSMDIDGDGMVDFNEFVVQLTSSKSAGEVDNERMERAFFEFATAHQRQKIIDSLNEKDNKLNDVQKYYQLRKLFKMELLQSESDGKSYSERSKAKVMAEMNHKRNHQHVVEKQRARFALSSIRTEKKLQSISSRDTSSLEHRNPSGNNSKTISKKLKAVEELDRELDDFIHGSTMQAPTNHLEVSLYQAFAGCINDTCMPYQKSKKIADGVLKRMSDYPLPRVNSMEVNRSGKFGSKMRTRVLDDLSNVKEMTTTYGHQLPPLPSIKL
jgi:Ca2+-binding EF-hand superfamily protein